MMGRPAWATRVAIRFRLGGPLGGSASGSAGCPQRTTSKNMRVGAPDSVKAACSMRMMRKFAPANTLSTCDGFTVTAWSSCRLEMASATDVALGWSRMNLRCAASLLAESGPGGSKGGGGAVGDSRDRDESAAPRDARQLVSRGILRACGPARPSPSASGPISDTPAPRRIL